MIIDVLITVVKLISPVRNGRFRTFSFKARHVLMKVRQTAGHRLRDVTQIAPAHHVPLQIVRQRTLTTTEKEERLHFRFNFKNLIESQNFITFWTHFWSV